MAMTRQYWLLPLLLLTCFFVVRPARADKHPTDPKSPSCKRYFTIMEQDEETVNLALTGFNKEQQDWYAKHGGEYPDLCFLNADASGKRVVASKDADVSATVAAYTYSIIGDSKKPLFFISWEEHREFDAQRGHYYTSSNGTLNRWDYDKSDFVPVGPVHNTNRTILTSSSVSFLKAALEEIIKQ